MNIATVKEWLTRQDHQVIQSPSSFWYDAGPRVFQAFPYHWVIRPSEQELQNLMLQYGILALRYSTPLDSPEGMVSYHVVLRQPYSFDMLTHQARNGVKRGMKFFKIEQISFDRLADEGWNLQSDTLDRQCRSDSMSQADWQRICLAAKNLPGFEAWAATVDGELAAALYTHRIDDTWYVPYAMSHRKYLPLHVNNALFYSVCFDLLYREGIKGMFLSLHSLDAPESVNEFKFRMNFSAIPVRQRVVFHPALAPFTNRYTHTVFAYLMKRHPKSCFLSKAEGMLRFHVHGKLPAAAQNWPECVRQYRPHSVEPVTQMLPEGGTFRSAEI